jgi:hypothetical protein
MIAVISLRGGSKVTGGLSVRGVVNVAVRDWPDDFTFIVGDHCYRRPSPVAQFLSDRVSKFHRIDATISELRLEIDDGNELFVSVLEAAKCEGIPVDSTHRQTFAAICATLCNSELYKSVCGQLRDEITMENVVDRRRFLSAV